MEILREDQPTRLGVYMLRYAILVELITSYDSSFQHGGGRVET